MNNRQIKLRAWDGSEMIYPYGKGFNNILTNGNILDRFSIVMQYTGLKDKNGKEIYEGDIVNVNYGGDNWLKETVVFDCAAFKKMYGNSDGSFTKLPFTSLSSRNTEVIGNIYEHSHLINEKNT